MPKLATARGMPRGLVAGVEDTGGGHGLCLGFVGANPAAKTRWCVPASEALTFRGSTLGGNGVGVLCAV